MRWSYRVGNIQGVAIHVHALFLVMLVWAAWLGWKNGATFGSAVFALVSLIALFAGVLVHEIAHTKQALAAGIPVRRITLLPIGGLAELRTLPEDPRVELKIAAAGPLANLGIALILGGLTLVLTGAEWIAHPLDILSVALTPTPLGLLVYLALANFALFAFNLLPVYPLDGGRIVRSVLSFLISPLTASQITATIGRALAFGMGGIAIFGLPAMGLPANASLVALALFLYIASGLEASSFDQRMRLRGRLVKSIIEDATTSIETVTPAEALKNVLSDGVFDRQPIVPVIVGGKLVGLLTVKASRRALRRPGLDHVAHAMQTRFPRATVDDTLWEAQQMLHSARLPALPVVRQGLLLGLITRRDLHGAAAGKYRRRVIGRSSSYKTDEGEQFES